VDVTDSTASEYLRQKIGVPALNNIYEKQAPGGLWDTRFFRDGQAEEYSGDPAAGWLACIACITTWRGGERRFAFQGRSDRDSHGVFAE
jgi:hypothetical protein